MMSKELHTHCCAETCNYVQQGIYRCSRLGYRAMVDKGHTGTTGQVTLTTDEGTTDHGDSEKSRGRRIRAREDRQG